MKRLRDFTMARVGLGRAGSSLPTREVLDFQLAHALARDAVRFPFDVAGFRAECDAEGYRSVALQSAAKDRASYLRRPDLGRRLSSHSRTLLEGGPFDLAVVVADGLSALAVHRHAIPLLQTLLPLCSGSVRSPLYLVEQGRVAIGDEISCLLEAKMVLVLIGERPGLSSPDSLGAYLTWNPRPGRTDAERNCISNIRAEGLPPQDAALRIFALMEQACRLQLTGVRLKETYERSLP